MIGVTIDDVQQEMMDALWERESSNPVIGLNTFEEAGVLTNDSGFVVNFQSGDTFYITIQKK